MKVRKKLYEVMDEKDSYCMKLAVQSDELNKRHTDFAALEKQVEVLRLELKWSKEETEALEKVDKQNVIKADVSTTECAALHGENKMLKTRVLDLQSHVHHLESKTKEINSMSIASSFMNEEYWLDGSVDKSLTVKNEEEVSLLVKNLSLHL